MTHLEHSLVAMAVCKISCKWSVMVHACLWNPKEGPENYTWSSLGQRKGMNASCVIAIQYHMIFRRKVRVWLQSRSTEGGSVEAIVRATQTRLDGLTFDLHFISISAISLSSMARTPTSFRPPSLLASSILEILEHLLLRSPKMILRDRCSASYDLALFSWQARTLALNIPEWSWM